MNKKLVSGILFGIGIAGIFVSEALAIKNTVTAKEILERHPVARNESATLVGVTEEDGTVIPQFDNIVPKPQAQYAKEIVETTWKAYIPTVVSTTVTVGCLVASKMIDAKTIGLLSTAAASGIAMIGKYREKIADRTSNDILHEIDNEVAQEMAVKAEPRKVRSGGLISDADDTDLAALDGSETYVFYDPYLNLKFESTKLGVLGAKYYLNRNFAIGLSASLQEFYGFLGIAVPEEHIYDGWDMDEFRDDGYMWIDINTPRCTSIEGVDYLIEYGYDPGVCEESYFPYGDPRAEVGSYAV